ncbi:MAG: hypothetical protein ACOC5A_04385 [Halanaerobiales bacterium]
MGCIYLSTGTGSEKPEKERHSGFIMSIFILSTLLLFTACSSDGGGNNGGGTGTYSVSGRVTSSEGEGIKDITESPAVVAAGLCRWLIQSG